MTRQIPARTLLRRALAIGFTGLALLAAGASHADALDTITQKGVIRVAIDPAAPPYSSKDASMAYVGSEVDVAQLLAKDLGLKLEVVPTTPANRIPYVLTDKTDLVISTLSITPEREKVVDFSVPYSGIQVIVGAPRATALGQLDELVGRKVAVVRGSTNDIELSRSAKPGTQILRFDDDATAMTALLSGQAEFYCTAPALLLPVNQRHPELAMQPKVVLKTNLTGIAMRRNEPRLKARVDDWVRENLRNGKLATIYRTHFGSELSPDVSRAAGF